MWNLEKRIREKFVSPGCNRSLSTTVRFRLHRNGDMSDLRLVKSSGNPALDRASLKAVKNASRFHALPAVAQAPVDIEFKFSASSARSRRSSYGANEPVLAPYLEALQRRLRESNPWSEQGSQKTVIQLSMLRNGVLEDVFFVSKSESATFDDRILESVKHASPVELPSGLKNSIFVQVVFENQRHAIYLKRAWGRN
ncbi:MAG: TonB family protein [Cyanobacteria bacterium HKST-UBA02]|nr:TonB family protein [Cyanobacteria bacterium HKST-UBA02]